MYAICHACVLKFQYTLAMIHVTKYCFMTAFAFYSIFTPFFISAYISEGHLIQFTFVIINSTAINIIVALSLPI